MPRARATRILCAASAVYIIVANVIGSGAPYGIEPQPGDPAWLVHIQRYLLGVMSLSLLVMASVIRRAAVNPKNWVNRSMGSHWTSTIVASSLCESIGIFGLIVFLMEGEFV